MRKLVLALLLLSTISAWAVTPHIRVRRHRSLIHRIFHRKPVWRAFPPTHEALVAQNVLADSLGLERFYDDLDLEAATERGDMVPILETQYVVIAKTLPRDRALVRPWVNDFLQDLGRAFYEQFHQPIQVNSAVRTQLVQKKLRRWNRNAAPIDGESASSHMAGATIDLQRRGLSKAQIRFIELKLLVLYSRQQVIVEEELAQPCFHTMVSGNYGKPWVETIPATLEFPPIDDNVEIASH